jgi:N-methylhydantoinase A
MASAGGPWRIGVDIGGTFTDLVLVGASQRLGVYKVATVPADPSRGVIDALDRAATAHDLDVPGLLRECALFVHGSTIATNTVLEGKGARTGVLTTEGFRDSLEIRRGQRDDPWSHREPYPPVLVARELRRPVRGRIDRDGHETLPLTLEDVDAAAERFLARDIESIALCLFNSYLNPAHEQAVAQRLRALGIELPLSQSSHVAPVLGEYERTSTTVLNAYVAPRTLTYLRKLNARLGELGLASPLLLIQSNGGAISIDELGGRPVTLLLSGPASGVGALDYYRTTIGSGDLVSMEIGGTSCDVILMSRGEVAFTDLLDIGGYKCVIPSVDVHTIGAGGGTIARVDGGGLLHVGPRGAGAIPGPACYGLGGADPTITDAQVVLGRLKPGPYADGAVSLDGNLAREAIASKIAAPLGLPIERAAAGVIQLMEQKLLHAVQHVSSERGHDPRQLTLVAAGGAGPLHASAVARALACARVYVPRLSGAFCAVGMLHSNLRHDYLRVHLAQLDASSPAIIDDIFAALEREASAALAREGFAASERRLLRALDLRYLGQQWDVMVNVGPRFDPVSIRRDFEAMHERLFGHIQPGGSIEITKLRASGIGLMPPLAHAALPAATTAAVPRERRRVWIDSHVDWCDTPVYSGADLLPGHGFVGPAIVDEQTTTLLVGAGERLEVDATGNYSIALEPRE